MISQRTKLMVLSFLYLIALASAGLVTRYINVAGGISLHFAILLSLIVKSAVTQDKDLRGFWLALGLAPLIRIIILTGTITEISEIFLYVLIGIPIFAGIFALMRNLKIDFADIGFNGKAPLVQALMAVGGIGLGLLDYLILKPEALNNQLNIGTTLLPALILLVFIGFMEEIAFRGVMQREARALGAWGWAYIAAVYAVLQISQGSFLQLTFVLLASLFFGWVVKRTGSIIGVSLAQGLLTIGLLLIFPHIL